MNDVTQILSAVEWGDSQAAEKLLPLLYDDLRKLAAARLAQESPGQTLQPTALVHEAYLRLVTGEHRTSWQHRGHFFAAAGEAMRRVLVENARRKESIKHGGGRSRVDLEASALAEPQPRDEILALDAALTKLAAADESAAKLVHLHHFAGLTLDEAAGVLEISARSTDRLWAYAKAWLHREIQKADDSK